MQLFATETGRPYFLHSTLSPVVSIAVVVLATLVAMTLVPSPVLSVTALRIPSLILACGLVAGMLIRVWGQPTAALDPLNIVSAAPVYWVLLDTIQAAYELPDVSSGAVQGTFLAIGLFSSGVWVAAAHRPWRVPKLIRQATEVYLPADRLFGVATLAFALAFLRFAIPSGFDVRLMWDSLFESRWGTPWSRGALGGWNSFLDHLAYFGYVLPALAVSQGRIAGWFNWKTIATFFYAIIIGILLTTSGGRRILGVFAGSGFVVWFLSAELPRLKHVLVFVGSSVVLLVVLQLVLLYRGVGIGHAFDSSSKVTVQHRQYLHVDDNFLRTAQLIDIIPEHHPHVTWRWVLWVAARPIPRVLWPGKPLDPGFSLPDYLGAKGVSYSSSIVGELYMAFGYFGCLVGGWFYGNLAMMLRNLMRVRPSPGSLVVFGAGLFALFVGVRSGIELVLMAYGILAWVILTSRYGRMQNGSDSRYV